jgi:hypothetical protein
LTAAVDRLALRHAHARRAGQRDTKRRYRYTNTAGIAASRCTGTLEVTPKGSGCMSEWPIHFLSAAGVSDILKPLLKMGLESLKPRFGEIAANVEP